MHLMIYHKIFFFCQINLNNLCGSDNFLASID